MLRTATALAIVSLLAGCATWHEMDRSEKGTAVGATGGAIVGAAVGGPVGAAVGAGVGGYAGHYESDKIIPADRGTNASASTNSSAASSSVVRLAQMSLNDRGFNAGAPDGVMGPTTEAAVRDFQQAQRLPQTGTLDQPTLNALGVTQ